MADRKIIIHAFRCGSVKYSGDKKRYGVYSYLVEHPKHGNILIDTGLSEDCRDTWPKHLVVAENPRATKEETAVSYLDGLGLKPDDIDLLLISHLDADEVSALRSFAGRAKRIVVAEHEYFYSCRMVYRLRQPTELWMPYIDEIERPYFTATNMGPQGRGLDLFGDESVILIHTPGHTEGQIMIMVSNGGNGRVLSGDGIIYGGDYVVFSSDAVFEPMTFDIKGQKKAEDYLSCLREDRECLGIFPSHSFNDVIEHLEF